MEINQLLTRLQQKKPKPGNVNYAPVKLCYSLNWQIYRAADDVVSYFFMNTGLDISFQFAQQ